MLEYILKRTAGAIISLFVVITLIFVLLRLMPMEGYFGAEYDKLSEEVRASMLAEKGLDQPIYVQLFNFYKSLFQGDLGKSWIYRPNYPIVKILEKKIPYSLKIGVISMIFSLMVGIPLGAVMARFKGKIADKLGTAFIAIVEALPTAVLMLFLQLFFSSWFNLSLLFDKNNYATWVLPIFSISLLSICSYAMWMRRYMIDNINMDYVKLARAKGVSGSRIMFRHVFKNAFVPMAQFLPGSVLPTIIGSIYIEHLYSIPGTGSLLIDVIQLQDNTMVQALVLIYAAIGIAGMFLGDVLMALIDPRISFVKKGDDR